MIKLPPALKSDAAATLAVSYLVAWNMLKTNSAGRGKTILVYGAASGVGMATIQLGKALGAKVKKGGSDENGGLFVEIDGAGLRGARPAEIDVGNSGTLLRILPGWVAGQGDGEWTFDGDESIRADLAEECSRDLIDEALGHQMNSLRDLGQFRRLAERPNCRE